MTLKQNFKAGFKGVEEKATSFIAPTKGQDLQRGWTWAGLAQKHTIYHSNPQPPACSKPPMQLISDLQQVQDIQDKELTRQKHEESDRTGKSEEESNVSSLPPLS